MLHYHSKIHQEPSRDKVHQEILWPVGRGGDVDNLLHQRQSCSSRRWWQAAAGCGWGRAAAGAGERQWWRVSREKVSEWVSAGPAGRGNRKIFLFSAAQQLSTARPGGSGGERVSREKVSEWVNAGPAGRGNRKFFLFPVAQQLSTAQSDTTAESKGNFRRPNNFRRSNITHPLKIV
jgi:hypothetical protein